MSDGEQLSLPAGAATSPLVGRRFGDVTPKASGLFCNCGSEQKKKDNYMDDDGGLTV